MRICVIGLELGPTKEGAYIGGVTNSVVRLCQGLSLHHEITVITTPPRGQEYKEYVKECWAEIYQIRVIGVYPQPKFGIEFTIKSISLLRKLHKNKKFDIVIGHSGYPIVSVIPGLAGKLLRIPSIHSLYCPIESQDKSIRINRLLNITILTKISLGLVNTIVSLTQNVKNSLLDIKINSNKIKVVPPSVNLAGFNPSVSGKRFRTKLGIDSSIPVILLVGNLTKQKGTFVALNAMKQVVRFSPNAKLILTSELPSYNGTNPDTEVRMSVSQLGLCDNIIYLGIINNMAELIAASDIIIIPFLSISGISDYPLVLLEAMAIGKPVIASNVGGVKEVVQNMENGMLIEAGNEKLLSQSIISLIEDQKLRLRLGRNAFEYVANKFSVENVTEQSEVVYEELIRK
jgi:glycosyltransferase involved in cell wall biosynthesis